jgi:hypothetical protein
MQSRNYFLELNLTRELAYIINLGLVYSRSFGMSWQETYRGQVLMLHGWEVRAYRIIPALPNSRGFILISWDKVWASVGRSIWTHGVNKWTSLPVSKNLPMGIKFVIPIIYWYLVPIHMNRLRLRNNPLKYKDSKIITHHFRGVYEIRLETHLELI